MSIIRRRVGVVILAGALSLAIFASARAASHAVLYSFTGGGDGTGPAARLTDLRGVLYGTTYGGGVHSSGAVFRVSTAGAEKLVYSFQNGTDGAGPKSPVVTLGGLLYGTTQYGGGSSACTGGCGTVFAVTPSGEQTMLYAFRGGADGANPTAGLIAVGGILYGTTSYGGRYNYGTVFSITSGGVENVLYSFTGGADGGNPMGRLFKLYGRLYGTTYTGGANHYYGTVFSITTVGVEKVVYSFKDGSDGAYPTAGLVSIGGALYGTSRYGAAHLGTVFSVTPMGLFTVLHSFRGGKDGSDPEGDLINLGGTLYGVTYQGGGLGCFDSLGCGTVFSVTPAKVERVVYSFKGGSDGLNPAAGLTDTGGILYGTTASGGTDFNGTVFGITP
jgi:uncharacterized repeat protein (TIGR03803 family)